MAVPCPRRWHPRQKLSPAASSSGGDCNLRTLPARDLPPKSANPPPPGSPVYNKLSFLHIVGSSRSQGITHPIPEVFFLPSCSS